MNIAKPQLIAGGFILFGCFLCLFGVYLSFGGKAEGQPVPQYLSTTNYNANTAISTSNTVIKRTNNASVQTKEKSLITEAHPAPSAETKTQVESKPVVKEMPPYPAPDGTKWTKVKNGWILSSLNEQKKPDSNELRETERSERTSEKPNMQETKIKPAGEPPPCPNGVIKIRNGQWRCVT